MQTKNAITTGWFTVNLKQYTDLLAERMRLNAELEEVQKKITLMEKRAKLELDLGKPVKGFKLKVGRKSRTIINPEELAKALKSVGFTDKDIYDTKMKGVPALEKLVKDTEFDMDKHIRTSYGASSMVFTG